MIDVTIAMAIHQCAYERADRLGSAAWIDEIVMVFK
jgi:hypothetical protein